MYSRGLTPECTDQSDRVCSVDGLGQIIEKSAIKSLMLDDQMVPTTINQSTDGTTYLLVPRLQPPKGILYDYQNFSATTFGTSANCSITTDCSLQARGSDSDTSDFECSSGFNGSIQYPSWLSVGQWWQMNESYDAMFAHSLDDLIIDLGVITFLTDPGTP